MVFTAGIVGKIPKKVSVDRRETRTRPEPWRTLTQKGQGEEVGRTKEAAGMTSESAASWKPWVGT